MCECCPKTLSVGCDAPCYKSTAVMPNQEFKEISKDDYKGKWVVLFSYPLDFTFVCPTEIIAFSEKVKEFRDINCEVIGMSVDSKFTHLAWMNTERSSGGISGIDIPLISDLGGHICRRYGWMLEKEGHSLRGTAIIDDKGVLRHLSSNHPEVGRNVDEYLRLVKAFQFTDKNGVVCPAQWVEGNDTIKPDVKESKAFFEKNSK